MHSDKRPRYVLSIYTVKKKILHFEIERLRWLAIGV